MKQVDTATDAPSRFEISPMEMTIEETLKLRADERRKKLKEFNSSFIIMFLKLMSTKETCL
jgi:cell division protein FtsZ